MGPWLPALQRSFGMTRADGARPAASQLPRRSQRSSCGVAQGRSTYEVAAPPEDLTNKPLACQPGMLYLVQTIFSARRKESHASGFPDAKSPRQKHGRERSQRLRRTGGSSWHPTLEDTCDSIGFIVSLALCQGDPKRLPKQRQTRVCRNSEGRSSNFGSKSTCFRDSKFVASLPSFPSFQRWTARNHSQPPLNETKSLSKRHFRTPVQ